MRRPNLVKRIVGIAALAILITGLFGFVIMSLWNWLMPAIFHLPPVTYWQAVGITLLARLLVGHAGAGHGGPRPFGPRFGGGPAGRNPFGRCGERKDECSQDDDPRHSFSGWSQYGAYWKEEGKDHFEDWLQRRRMKGESGSEA